MHAKRCRTPALLAPRQVLVRTAEMALGVGLPAVCALWLARGRIPAFFTSDPQAMAQAAKILPLIIL